MLKPTQLFVCAVLVVAAVPLGVYGSGVPSASVETQGNASNKEQIEAVMQQFHEAVARHDGTALAGLFLPNAQLWLNVLTESAYERARANDAKAAKVRVSSYQDFVKFVSSTSKQLDPQHTNVVIHTDGTIAAVYFDFVFNIDREGREQRKRDLAAGQSSGWLAHCSDHVFI